MKGLYLVNEEITKCFSSVCRYTVILFPQQEEANKLQEDVDNSFLLFLYNCWCRLQEGHSVRFTRRINVKECIAKSFSIDNFLRSQYLLIVSFSRSQSFPAV